VSQIILSVKATALSMKIYSPYETSCSEEDVKI
jgi:hypothetical protein